MALVPATSQGGASSSVGTVLAYVEFTANVTVSGINFAGANAVVTAGAVTYDGTAICIEFYSPVVETGALLAAGVFLVLCDGAADIGQIGGLTTPAAALFDATIYARRYLTPTAASHTYNVKAFRSLANGTVAAGTGAAGANEPGFIRITSA